MVRLKKIGLHQQIRLTKAARRLQGREMESGIQMYQAILPESSSGRSWSERRLKDDGRDFLAESQITQRRVAEHIKNVDGESVMPGDNLLGIFLDHVVSKRGNRLWVNLLDEARRGVIPEGLPGFKTVRKV